MCATDHARKLQPQRDVLRRVTRVYDADGNEAITVEYFRGKTELYKYMDEKASASMEKLQRCVCRVGVR